MKLRKLAVRLQALAERHVRELEEPPTRCPLSSS
jgi:hypothetical protein